MRAEFHACPESGVPPGRGPSSYAIQAINCLATIVKSLRDKKPTQLLRSSAKLALMGQNPRLSPLIPSGNQTVPLRQQTPSSPRGRLHVNPSTSRTRTKAGLRCRGWGGHLPLPLEPRFDKIHLHYTNQSTKLAA